jgi:structural maintenance of chromosome 2
LNFQFSDPEHNFKRSSVKGLVCKLFKLKDKAAATALETAGGGKVSRPQFLKAKICLKVKPF